MSDLLYRLPATRDTWISLQILGINNYGAWVYGSSGSPPLNRNRREGEGSPVVATYCYPHICLGNTRRLAKHAVVNVDNTLVVYRAGYRAFADEFVLGMLSPIYAIGGCRYINLMLCWGRIRRRSILVNHQVFIAYLDD